MECVAKGFPGRANRSAAKAVGAKGRARSTRWPGGHFFSRFIGGARPQFSVKWVRARPPWVRAGPNQIDDSCGIVPPQECVSRQKWRSSSVFRKGGHTIVTCDPTARGYSFTRRRGPVCPSLSSQSCLPGARSQPRFASFVGSSRRCLWLRREASSCVLSAPQRQQLAGVLGARDRHS